MILFSCNNSDEDGKHLDPVVGKVLEGLIRDIISNLRDGALEFYEREFSFFGQITDVSGRIRDKELGPARKVSGLILITTCHACITPLYHFSMHSLQLINII